MKQILHLIDTYRIGGPGKTIINAAKYIDGSRFRVHVGTFIPPPPAHNEFAHAVREAGIPLLELRETRRLNVGHVGQIRRYVEEHDIAIVHAHGYRTDALGYLATRGLRNVVIVTTHHGWIRNTAKQHAVTRFARWLCRRFDGVEVVCSPLLEELPRAIAGDGRAVVIHNAIVMQDYAAEHRRDAQRQALGVRPGDKLVGVVGRLNPEKGSREMLEAFAQVAAALPSAHLVFVGEGPLEPALRARVAELNLTDRVRFVPYQHRVHPFYEAIDLLVCPSISEGLSNVILEAQVFRRAVVATRVGGNGDIIEPDITGILIEPKQPDALAAAIQRVLEDDELRQQLGENAYRRVSREFAFDARMRKEERFYERVLATAR
jgi:glycosyltransferase involved in cell wall biosynthesis